jgi:hypothetical protein
MLYRDAHPPSKEQLRKARARARKSWKRRKHLKEAAAAIAQLERKRKRTQDILRSLSGGSKKDESPTSEAHRSLPRAIEEVREMKRLEVVVTACVLGVVGCEYGPEHLDAFYAQRNTWQAHIDAVESKHGLLSRDPWKRDAQLKAMEEARRAEQERERAFKEWFDSLTPEQRFEWQMKQAELAGDRDRIEADERMHQAEMEAVERERRRKIWVGDSVNVNVRHSPY